MANPYYGLGNMMGDVTHGMRVAGQEQAAQDTAQAKNAVAEKKLGLQEQAVQNQTRATDSTVAERKAELDKIRQEASNEGMVAATKLLLAGRTRQAEDAFNAQGKYKMVPGSLKYNHKTGLVTWTQVNPDGTEEKGQAVDRMLAAVAGIKWSDVTGKSGKGPSTPAAIQTIEYYAKNLFNGNKKQAAAFYNQAKSDPVGARATIFNALQKANSNMMPDQQKTSDQLWQESGQYVTQARQDSMKGYGLTEPANGSQPGTQPTAAPGQPDQTQAPVFNANDPSTWSSLWQ